MYRVCLAVCLSLPLVWSFGCAVEQEAAAPVAKIKGTISMDGKPIPSGEVHFGMMGVPPSVLKIADGAFSGDVPIGKNKVEVFIFVEGPPSEKYPGVATTRNIVPEKYWGPKTALEAAVKANGNEEFKFNVTSK